MLIRSGGGGGNGGLELTREAIIEPPIHELKRFSTDPEFCTTFTRML